MIIHFSTVHRCDDTRIAIKECAALSGSLKNDVAFFCTKEGGDHLSAGATSSVIAVGPRELDRFVRMTRGAWRMHRAVRMRKPSIVHFHDPELIWVGLLLKLSGIKVVYDVHEDVPRQILGKHWLHPWVRRPVAALVEGLEWLAAKVFDGIVTATPTISRRFPAHKTVTVQNFPVLAELVLPEPKRFVKRPPHVAYVGGITAARGVREMVEALSRVQNPEARLQLGGTFTPTTLEDEVRVLGGWNRVVPHGWMGRDDVAQVLGGVRAGLVVLHPTSNYPDALPVKMFEYMAAGLPVIASDFPLWRFIIEGAGCGLLVDPMNPRAIAEAIDWVIDHPEEAEAMGQRGRKAVEEKYNWENEAETLVNFYKQLLAK
ncbi:glycosyltransferase family 4 protein [Guyparkeria sp. 1SP6A2]|nr:glycosyltransferase family 4 protein [Guyparkeria sp. 1SP6A2]